MKRTETGAALAVGLILLSVLTILAISTMNTAATELLMSGNDQYHVRAAQAAESGIEQLIATISFESITSVTPFSAPLTAGDSYTATVRPRGATPAPVGYNPTFTAEHFEIESTGTSHRNAKVTYIQGLFVVRTLSTPLTAATSPIPPLCLSGIEIRPNICVEYGTKIRTYWRPSTHP